MEKKYTKLSELVGKTFTVEKAWGYQFKKYDPESRRMLIADRYEEGYRKTYSLDTDHGKLDVGSGQLASLLEAVYKNGEASLNGKTFEVKSNGKSGMDIRYYFNVARTPTTEPLPEPQDEVHQDVGGDINLSDIPF